MLVASFLLGLGAPRLASCPAVSLPRADSLLREAHLLIPAAWSGSEADVATGKTHGRA